MREIGGYRVVREIGVVAFGVVYLCAQEVPADAMRDRILATMEPLVESISVLEEYREQGKVPQGQKGMLWSITYRSPEKTLTDAEVDTAHEAIVAKLLSALGATRR